jgi:sigma-E factor negative regulatory protein RseA
MTEALKEQLSACLDGELPEAELDLLLKQVARDPELQRALGRYALIAQAMRSDAPAVASAGFAAKVMAGLESQPLARPDRAQRMSAAAARWLRPVAGLAVAAGVATVAILSLQPAEGPPQVVDIRPQPPPPDYVVPNPSNAPSTTSLIPATRLTNYVVAHMEYSSPLGRRTMLSGVLADDEVEPVDQTVELSTEPVQ